MNRFSSSSVFVFKLLKQFFTSITNFLNDFSINNTHILFFPPISEKSFVIAHTKKTFFTKEKKKERKKEERKTHKRKREEKNKSSHKRLHIHVLYYPNTQQHNST